jgi:integrase
MGSKRRGPGEGTIFTREREGRSKVWIGRLSLPNGKRKEFTGDTKREVQVKMAELKREVEAGYHGTLDAEGSVRQFFETWHASRRKELAPTTEVGYDGYLRNHMDIIGDMSLNEVRPLHLQKMYAAKIKTLSPTTVHHIHEFFHLGFKAAVMMELIPRNPCDFVKAPSMRVKQFETFSREQVMAMLQAATSFDGGVVVALALTTGLREAEIMGLTWADLSGQSLTVRKQMQRIRREDTHRAPKSRTSRRTLPLAPRIIDLLDLQRIQQDELKAFVGKAWKNDRDLIFTQADGRPLQAKWIQWRFKRMVKALGFNHRRFHDLRHTFATLLLEDGINIRVVSEWLGHSSINITLSTYGHVTPKMQSQAIATIVGWLPEGQAV